MRFILLLSILFGISISSFSQISSSFLGHMHFKQKATNPFARDLGVVPDSAGTFVRPTATAAVGYNSKGGTTVLAFAGIGIFHVTHKVLTNTYYTNYGVSLQLGTGASNGAVSLQNATTVGLFGHAFNNLLTIGIGYNFANKITMPLAGPGLAFH